MTDNARTTTPRSTQATSHVISSTPGTGRPRPPGPAPSSITFAGRALLKMTRLPEQMLDVLMIPILFTLMFTYLFGGALAGSTHRYLHSLLPGTMVMTVLIITMYTGSALNTDLAKGVYDRFRTLPIWQPAPLVGAQLADLARYAVAALLVIAVGLLMGYRPAGGPPAVVATIALVTAFASGLGWIFTTLGLVMRTPGGVFTTGTLVVFPLTFASNTFVDPATMPPWLRTLVDANPVSRLVTTSRDILDGHPQPTQAAWVLAVATALTLTFAPLSLYLYRRGA
jgi:daunorubicin/doxorubicin transport system permease protein